MAAKPITPGEALARLQEGNARYVAGARVHPHTDAARRSSTTEHGQSPFAVVVACSDSRVPVEILFDQGIGDLFVIRVPGNVCNPDEIGGIEYSAEHLETPLCVVLGHSRCGAVTAVVEGAPLDGNIAQLAAPIRLAVSKARTRCGDIARDRLVEEAVDANIWQAIEDLFRGSPCVRQRVRDGRLRVVGARYDLAAGHVAWLGEHTDQAALVDA